MPRAERPIEAEDSELGQFAADLRRLREKAGTPTYRELSARAHYSPASLAEAASGRRLPTLALVLAYVTACDGDPEEWEQRWRDIAAPPEVTVDAPYVGLKAFQPEDADRFFGREKLTAKLVDLVAKRPFAGVFGASGSGKSSLLRAGLVPRLDHALIFTPGSHPIDECAVHLARLTGESVVVLRAELEDPAALGLRVRQHDERLVLVVDQFEEVFTLTGAAERDWFVQALTQAPHVVIGVRADFYGHVTRHPELVAALEGAQLMVGPMTADELRRAITEPVLHVGGTVETALVTRLVADVVGQPAALPLVQHALVETWHRRRGMTLTLAGYEEAGGVEHAIARTAEAVFTGLPADRQPVARQIFLRLIALGEGTEDTKRRAARADLDADVLESLATSRLVTLTEGHVELTHEALIRSWPRLRDWIAEDRAKLRVHHQLTEAVTQWDGRDPDGLYQGARLEQASDLDPGTLTEPERAFLHASQVRSRRRTRRVRVVVATLSVLVVLLAGTVVFAVDQATRVAAQQGAALARSAAESVRAVVRDDPKTALRVALAAHRVAPSDESRDVLLMADAALRRQVPNLAPAKGFFLTDGFVVERDEAAGSDTPPFRVWRVAESTGEPYAVLPGVLWSASADRRRMLVSRDLRSFDLVDTSDPARPRVLTPLPGPYSHITPLTDTGNAFAGVRGASPENTDGTARVWYLDNAGGVREVVLPGANVRAVMLSGDGRLLAVSRDRGVTELWRLDGEQPRQVHAWENQWVVSISPDSKRFLLYQGETQSSEVWDVSDPDHPVRWARFPDRKSGRAEGAFSADGRRIALGEDFGVQVFDIGEREVPRRLAGFEDFVDRLGGATAHLPEKDAFVVMDGIAIWFLRTDVGAVTRDACAEPGVRLSDVDWEKYFPGVTREEVC